MPITADKVGAVVVALPEKIGAVVGSACTLCIGGCTGGR